MVSMFKREIKVGSAVIEYSGSDHVIERINCTDRIEEEIIVQVALLCFALLSVVSPPLQKQRSVAEAAAAPLKPFTGRF